MLRNCFQKIVILTIAFVTTSSCISDVREQKNNEKLSHSNNSEITSTNYLEVLPTDSSNYLLPISNDSILKYDSECAFINKKGDTIIPWGKYRIFESDTLYNYLIVQSSSGIIGINILGEKVFDAYLFGDCQLDSFSDGLSRISRNGQIGYINRNGEIVIPCKFDCAERFKNGFAKVSEKCSYEKDDITNDNNKMKSNNWFLIVVQGNKINT